MKEFLQMDGMVYKLVPVRTKLGKENYGSDMGYIDTDVMYNIVMKWDWGNSESTTIYHDPETRKNSISYRMNLSRLMKQLIVEGKNEKAKKVIELALTKLPLNYYGYYSLVESFATGYYEIGETQNARKLLKQLTGKYQETLKYYSSIPAVKQNDLAMEIITDIERYRSLLTVMKENNDDSFYTEQKNIFNNYNKRFERFERDVE